MSSVVRGESKAARNDDVLVVVHGDGGLPGRLDIGFVVESPGGVGAIVATRINDEDVRHKLCVPDADGIHHRQAIDRFRRMGHINLSVAISKIGLEHVRLESGKVRTSYSFHDVW